MAYRQAEGETALANSDPREIAQFRQKSLSAAAFEIKEHLP
jgi:hypothetical protein